MATTPPDGRPGDLGTFEQLARAIRYVRLAVTVFVAAGVLMFGILSGTFLSLGMVFGGLILLVLVVMTVLAFLPGSGRYSRGERLRFQMLITLGLVGALMTLLGLLLPFSAAYAEVITGGMAKWRANSGKLLAVAIIVPGGLGLMFVGLLLARGYERSHAVLRRLLYGYNAVVSSLVLLFILALINILAFVPLRPFSLMAQTADWTSSRIYSLKDSSKKTLAGLDQNLEIFALIPQADSMLHAEVLTLLQNCRAANPSSVRYTFYSPDLNREDIKDLKAKYNLAKEDARGLLLVYGPEDKKVYKFIPRSDLLAPNPNALMGEEDTPGISSDLFNGENVVINAVKYLAGGKTKTQIYFTQGNGELDLNSQASNRPDEGLGKVTAVLGQENCDIKPLRFDDADAGKEIMKADVVVIAGPRMPFTPAAITTLRNYLKGEGEKKGKLLVLLDNVRDRASIDEQKMLQTNLEPLLAEYGVRVNDDRVLAVRMQDPTTLLGVTNPDSSNPIARAFFQAGTEFVFRDARSVEVIPPPPNAPARARAEGFVLVPPELFPWSEKSLTASPVELVAKFRRDPKAYNAVRPKGFLYLAASVTENRMAMPPGHPPLPGAHGDQQPVLMVFGDASWVANQGLTRDNLNLFANCIIWLSERKDIGERAEPPQRKNYDPPRDPKLVDRLKVLPAFLMLLAIIGLGGGIWVVRRR